MSDSSGPTRRPGRTAPEDHRTGPLLRPDPRAPFSHRAFAGNRPTTTFPAREPTPSVPGQSSAPHEHTVAGRGAVRDIDAFGRWGVRLGKVLAGRVEPALTGAPEAEGLHPHTAALVAAYRTPRK